MTEAFALGYPQVAARSETAERRATSFFLVGLNHRTAPVDVRERLSVGEAKLAEVTQSLTRLPSIDGACVLSTCNRVEVLVSCSAEDVADSVIDWLARYGRTPREVLEPHLYIRRGSEA